MSFRPRLFLSLALFITSLLIACGGGNSPGDQGQGAEHLVDGARQRMIVDDPEICAASKLWHSQETAVWRVADSKSPWTAPRSRRSEEGLVAGLASGRVRMVAEVDLEAHQVRELEVRLARFTGGHLRVYWAREGETLDEKRYLRRRMVGKHSRQRVLRFPVAQHPEWTGRIVRLRLEAHSLDNKELLLQEVRALRLTPTDDFDTNVLQPCKIELADDLRSARYAVPGQDIEWQAQAGGEHVLRFAYGGASSLRTAVDFKIHADERLLFSERLQPLSSGEDPGWHDVRLVLGEHLENLGEEARPLSLRFSVHTEEGFDPSSGLPAWAHPEIVRPEKDPPWNVLLISIDTLRADRLSLYGHDRETTPNIDAWSADAAVFESAVSQAPWTLPAHFSMFTGLDTLRHGVNHSRAPDGRERFHLLAERLRDAGWATGAATGGAFVHPSYGLAQGFDVYRSWSNRARDTEELPTGIRKTLDWFEAHSGEPSFFFLHTYAVHDPFEAHEPFFTRLGGDPRQITVQGFRIGLHSPPPTQENDFRHAPSFVLRHDLEAETVDTPEEFALVNTLYDSGVAAMDEQIGRLLEEIKRRGLAEHTLIILTSDHGEALGETAERISHVTLHDSVLKIPLIIAAPDGHGHGRRVREQVRLVDIVPTILDRLGLLDEQEAQSFDGVSLVSVLDGDDSLPGDAWSYAPSSNHGISLRRGDRLKYIFNNTAWASREQLREIYDLRRDPDELNNLAEDASQEMEALHRAATDYYEAVAPGARLRILNGAPSDDPPQVLRGEISGLLVQGNNVKSFDLACDCLRFIEEGSAAFEVPPGESFTLIFEKHVAEEITVRGEYGTTSFEQKIVFRPEKISTWSFQNGRLKEEEGASIETGFVAWDRGVGSAGRAVEPDAELLEQLEALGYMQ